MPASFVTNMRADPNDMMIVKATVELGRDLGLRVVAEGVEDAKTWQDLVDIGCDVAPGFFLSTAARDGDDRLARGFRAL